MTDQTMKNQSKVRELVYISLFTVIMTVCSWISIPTLVPFTLQTAGVFSTVGLLGGKRGTIAVFLYILLGVLGVPVFAGFSGGVGVVVGLTGGYIIGFLFAALLMWGIEKLFGRTQKVLLLSMFAGLLVCYAVGTAWFMIVYAGTSGGIGLWSVLARCVIPFLIPDLFKIALSMLLCERLKKVIQV